MINNSNLVTGSLELRTAANGQIEGGLVSGQTWNQNGTVLNPNALGGIRSAREGNDRVRLNGLVATGAIDLGGMLPGQSEDFHIRGITLRNRRRIDTGSFLDSSHLSGTNIARAALYNWLNARYSNVAILLASSRALDHPIIGTVRMTGGTGQQLWSRQINITHLGRTNATEYRLFGMGTDGIRYFIWVPNTGTSMTLMNRGANTNIDGGTSVGTFTSITVDLVQV